MYVLGDWDFWAIFIVVQYIDANITTATSIVCILLKNKMKTFNRTIILYYT